MIEPFKKRIPDEMVGIMVLMVTKGRASEILSVIDYFVDLVKEENQKQIIMNNEKAKEVRINGFDHKFTTTLACSLVAYLLLFLL